MDLPKLMERRTENIRKQNFVINESEDQKCTRLQMEANIMFTEYADTDTEEDCKGQSTLKKIRVYFEQCSSEKSRKVKF